jgi:hypothetical protein
MCAAGPAFGDGRALAGNVVYVCTVVLSSGLRRNSYTPADLVREALLGSYHGVNGAFVSLSIAQRGFIISCAGHNRGPKISSQ